MKKLLRVTKGMKVSEQDDISRLIPDFTDVRNYALGVWGFIPKDLGCGCNHDSYFSGTDQVGLNNSPMNLLHGAEGINPGESFGGYASAVHETPGHKCYPYKANTLSGSTTASGNVVLRPNDCPCGSADPLNVPSNRMVNPNGFIDSLNRWTVQSIVDALVAKKCFSKEGIREVALTEKTFFVLYDIVKYASDFGALDITGISCVDTTLGDVPNHIWNNLIILHVSNVNVSPNFKMLHHTLMQKGITVRFGTQAEIEPVLNHKDTVLNWSFGITTSNNDILDFVFSGCRSQITDQHVVTVKTSRHIVATVPEEVGMLMNHKGSFHMAVTMPEQYMLGTIFVNGVGVSVDSMNIQSLSNMGITVSQVNEGCSPRVTRGYNIIVTNIVDDMNIDIVEIPVANNIESLRCVTSEPMFSIRDEGDDVITIETNIRFERNNWITDLSGLLRVCAFPVGMYDVRNIPSKYTVNEFSVSQVPNGFGLPASYVIRTKVSKDLFRAGDFNASAVIIRFVFNEGSLRFNIDGEAFANPYFCTQFEVATDNTRPLTSYAALINGSWNPTIPLNVPRMKVAKEQADYFTLIWNGNGHKLVNVEGTTVPVGLTNKSVYNTKDIYVHPSYPEADAYYFAQLLIPVDECLNDRTSNGFYIAGGFSSCKTIDMRVTSMVNAEFYFIANSVSKRIGPTGAYCIEYQGLQRPLLNGYIEIPVVFGDKDDIIIEIPTIQRKFRIMVDLDIRNDEIIDGDSKDDGENPDSGSGGDDLIDEEKKDPEEGNESETGTEESESGREESEKNDSEDSNENDGSDENDESSDSSTHE